jgi:urease accessory protein
MAGGDRLTLDIDLAAGSQVLLTSPGAAKWYDSFGRQASQQLQVRQQAGSLLEWLPQETILYAGVPCGWTTSSACRAMPGCWLAR